MKPMLLIILKLSVRRMQTNELFDSLILLTTKDTARHSVEMQELSLKMPERATTSEAAINEELDTALENATV